MRYFFREVSILFTIAFVSIALSFPANVCAEKSPKVYGEELEVPESGETEIAVKIKGNSGLMGFKIQGLYEPSEIELLSISQGEITKTGTFVQNVNHKTGIFDVLWAHVEDVTKDGALFYVNIKYKNNASKEAEIELRYSQEDTFNEAWEDVVLDMKKFRSSGEDSEYIHEKANKEVATSKTQGREKKEKSAKKITSKEVDKTIDTEIEEHSPNAQISSKKDNVDEKQEKELTEKNADIETGEVKGNNQDTSLNKEQKPKEEFAMSFEGMMIIVVLSVIVAIISGVLFCRIRKRSR